ncbi:hypothetical protein B0H19DRAFT_195709 [Mycena capillaripes]|nr:hypothetical protein B0H19DRAFT_195709 [Mycena capillaripes]
MAIPSRSACVAMTSTLRGWQFPRGFSLRTSRTHSAKNKEYGPESDLLERAEPTERKMEDTYIPETPYTGRDVLRYALKTLSSASNDVPLASVLNSVIGPLSDIANRIEPTSANTPGLVEFAARIELLSPLVYEMARDRPQQGQAIVETLQQELQTMTKELEDAHSHGRLEQFFSDKDDRSPIAKHNNHVAQLIADATRFSSFFKVLSQDLMPSPKRQKTAARSSLEGLVERVVMVVTQAVRGVLERQHSWRWKV